MDRSLPSVYGNRLYDRAVQPGKGAIILLYDQIVAEKQDLRLSNQSLKSMWYIPASRMNDVDWLSFLISNECESVRNDDTLIAREKREFDRSSFTVSLGGKYDRRPTKMNGIAVIERWESNTDFRVKLDHYSEWSADHNVQWVSHSV